MSENYKLLTQRREVAKDSLAKPTKRRHIAPQCGCNAGEIGLSIKIVNQDMMDFYQNLSASLAPPATSALCIASHRKAMSHSRSDAEGAGVASLRLCVKEFSDSLAEQQRMVYRLSRRLEQDINSHP